MPEGDSVYRLARRMRTALEGQVLRSTEFRVPQLATANLAGYRVTEVVPRGKHLLLRLHNPDSEQPALSLHSHLMMEGRWDFYVPGARFKRPAHTARVILRTESADVVGYDIQQLRLVPTDQESELVGHLGPDLLGPDWDPGLAAANLRCDPRRTIGTALLDQRLLAGLGNIYRCEVLFLTRLHPLTPCGQVAQLDQVVAMSHRLIQANKDRGRRVTTGTARTRDPFWVYGRAGKPCLRCGTGIRLLKLAEESGQHERDCYYCPHCQQLEQ